MLHPDQGLGAGAAGRGPGKEVARQGEPVFGKLRIGGTLASLARPPCSAFDSLLHGITTVSGSTNC